MQFDEGDTSCPSMSRLSTWFHVLEPWLEHTQNNICVSDSMVPSSTQYDCPSSWYNVLSAVGSIFSPFAIMVFNTLTAIGVCFIACYVRKLAMHQRKRSVISLDGVAEDVRLNIVEMLDIANFMYRLGSLNENEKKTALRKLNCVLGYSRTPNGVKRFIERSPA